jgi:hypothetical protein
MSQEVCIREPIIHLPDDRVDLQLNDWFSTDSLAENVITVINNVKLTTSTAVIVNSTEGMIKYYINIYIYVFIDIYNI